MNGRSTALTATPETRGTQVQPRIHYIAATNNRRTSAVIQHDYVNKETMGDQP